MAADSEQQSEAERLEIARRYRERRGRQLREAAGAAIGAEVGAAGEFHTVAFEAYASVPLVGPALAVIAVRSARRRTGLPDKLLLALDSGTLYVIDRNASAGSGAVASWPRSAVRVRSLADRFMQTEVAFDPPDRPDLKLFTTPLRTNPWSAEVVRLLGGEPPQPLDLSEA